MKVFENLNLQDLENEIWKDIEDYPDYQVSNFGRIKSFIKYRGTDERILRQCKDSGKYFIVVLYKNGKEKTKQVHRLVFETFIGKLEKGYNIHHIDEDKENNNLDNLKLMSESEHTSFHMKGKNNPMFGKHHSEETKNKMSENHYNKITNQKIIDIQEDLNTGYYTQVQMAKKHGVSKSVISNIKTGKLTTR